MISNATQRQWRWRDDCRMGQSHQLDPLENRQTWVDGEVRFLIHCSWCDTWVASNKVEEEMLSWWPEEAKRYWRGKHPR